MDISSVFRIISPDYFPEITLVRPSLLSSPLCPNVNHFRLFDIIHSIGDLSVFDLVSSDVIISCYHNLTSWVFYSLQF